MLTGKIEVLGFNPISLSLCPPQIPQLTEHGPPHEPGLVGRIEDCFVNLPFWHVNDERVQIYTTAFCALLLDLEILT